MCRGKNKAHFLFIKMSLDIGGAIASITNINELHVIISTFCTVFLILKNTIAR